MPLVHTIVASNGRKRWWSTWSRFNVERLNAARTSYCCRCRSWIDVDVVNQCVAIDVSLLTFNSTIKCAELTVVSHRNVLQIKTDATNLSLSLSGKWIDQVKVRQFAAYSCETYNRTSPSVWSTIASFAAVTPGVRLAIGNSTGVTG